MALCPDCGKEMLTADGCDFKKIVLSDGRKFNRQKVGMNSWTPRSGRCGDCGAKCGYYHHFGCDMETCPVCGGQAAFCECDIKYLEK